MTHDRIYESEKELIPLQDEYEEIIRELELINQVKSIEVENLAFNLSKTKGARGHELSTKEKRDVRVLEDLKEDKEYQELLSRKFELSKDIRYLQIEIDYLKREHERELLRKPLPKEGEENKIN